MAIPERFRLLNIALVDVGAGTSDISITNDGSILAYGMIPAAGDEITECLARHYLTDFAEAEKIKCRATTRKQITYRDIMGLSHKITSQEVAEVMEDTVCSITKQIADRILELNGNKPVSAVFIVGGGGKVKRFAPSLAEYLGLQEERVAIRGSEVLGEIEFEQKNLKVDSLLVTPIGICLNYYEQRNNFIFVSVNGERIKLYDNSKLSVVDAALQIGLPNEELFPKRGRTLTYYVNGEKRTQRGEAGEAAVIRVNGREAGLNDKIVQNDKIEITCSTRGKDGHLTIGRLPEYRSSICFDFDGRGITCPRFVQANEGLVSEFYEIQEGDKIEILAYYTLEQVLAFMDISSEGEFFVNNAKAQMDTRVYDNFSIDSRMPEKENGYREEENSGTDGEITPEQQSEPAKADGVDLKILVNGEEVVLRNKPEYILVDVLDFYPFDVSEAKGDSLETLINGVRSDFTAPLHEGDNVSIRWVSLRG